MMHGDRLFGAVMNFQVSVTTVNNFSFGKYFHTLRELIKFVDGLQNITQVHVYEHEHWVLMMQVTPKGRSWYTV
jgi:hypothetical protein